MSKIIFKALTGSHAYGTNIETSDRDYKGVFLCDNNDILSNNYQDQINVSKDETYFELGKFLKLLSTGNPTMLELLFMPEDCIIEKTSEFDIILKHKDAFITKKCAQSFGGYAIAQIQKARGLNKKLNWEREKTVRKSPFDFVYAYEDGKSYPIKEYLHTHNMLQEFCGLVGLDHFPNTYVLYYDTTKEYHGIFAPNSEMVRVSSVPKEAAPITLVTFNSDAYSHHCREYKAYQTWLEERNTARYVDTVTHGQQIDGKNLMHCRRLLDMSLEIALGKGVIVRRPDRNALLDIRKGRVSLEDIIKKAEEDISGLDSLFKNSTLPEDVDQLFIKQLILKIRNEIH